MVNAIQKHARHDLGVTLSLPCILLVKALFVPPYHLINMD